MKKIILIAGLLFCGITQAQTITLTGNGNEITDGETITFNTLSSQTATLDLSVTNTSAETINIKMKVNQIINNAAGTGLQFCIDPQCFFQIDEGDTVPSNPQSGATIAPGNSTTGDNHFWNNYAGDDTSMPVSYSLSIITVSDTGEELNELISFNYVYDANAAGVTDFAALQKAGINLQSTVIKNNLTVETLQNTTMQLYNVAGQLVKSAALTAGNQSVDFADLNAAVYIARFTTQDNKTAQIRVVKQ